MGFKFFETSHYIFDSPRASAALIKPLPPSSSHLRSPPPSRNPHTRADLNMRNSALAQYKASLKMDPDSDTEEYCRERVRLIKGFFRDLKQKLAEARELDTAEGMGFMHS